MQDEGKGGIRVAQAGLAAAVAAATCRPDQWEDPLAAGQGGESRVGITLEIKIVYDTTLY